MPDNAALRAEQRRHGDCRRRPRTVGHKRKPKLLERRIIAELAINADAAFSFFLYLCCL